MAYGKVPLFAVDLWACVGREREREGARERERQRDRKEETEKQRNKASKQARKKERTTKDNRHHRIVNVNICRHTIPA